MVTALSSGIAALWSTFPILVQLKQLDCLSTERSPSISPGVARLPDTGLPWQLIGIALLYDGYPLAPIAILSTLTRGDASVLRVHVSEPDMTLFGESISDGSPVLRYEIKQFAFN